MKVDNFLLPTVIKIEENVGCVQPILTKTKAGNQQAPKFIRQNDRASQMTTGLFVDHENVFV